MSKSRCPECDSEQFITEPFHYDVLEFDGKDFYVAKEEFADEYKTFCRECSKEIDIDASEKAKKIILKN